MQWQRCLTGRAAALPGAKSSRVARHVSLLPSVAYGCKGHRPASPVFQLGTSKSAGLIRYSSHPPQSRHPSTEQKKPEELSPVTHYKPPTTGLVASLPQSWIPYAELVRLDKPTGTYYLFFPCLFSTLLAAPMAPPSSFASPTTTSCTSTSPSSSARPSQ